MRCQALFYAHILLSMRCHFAFVAGMLMLAAGSYAQQVPAPAKQKFHFGKPQNEEGGYTQAIKVGNTIYVSGTVALTVDSAGVSQVYRIISKSLEQFGAGLQHVVKESIFTTDIEAMKAANQYRKLAYKGDYPTSTWVQVSRLYMHEARLEIEVIAVLPDQ